MLPPQVIAEIGQAHDGSLGILHSMIDAIAAAGARIIKFQMHIADAESSVHDEFRVRFSRVDATRYDYWKRMELTPEQWAEVKSHCESLGCEFFCTPFSVRAVNLLEDLGVARYKVGSGDVNNLLLLEAIARTGKPAILSSGMSTLDELDRAVELLRGRSGSLAVMQCTSQYPVKPERWGLNYIGELRSRYGLPTGLSDHSGTIFPGLAAVALGASFIEVHAVFDKQMFGPDATSSLSMSELGQLVKGVGDIATALATHGSKNDVSEFSNMRRLFGRSLTVATDLQQGSVLTFADLEAAKPAGYGIEPREYELALGKRLKRSLTRGSFLTEGDIE